MFPAGPEVRPYPEKAGAGVPDRPCFKDKLPASPHLRTQPDVQPRGATMDAMVSAVRSNPIRPVLSTAS